MSLPYLNEIVCIDALELLRALPDKSVDVVLTDPPYNLTNAAFEVELDLVALGKELFRVIKERGAIISTAAQPFTSKMVMAWFDYFQYEWIWRKSRKTNFLNAKIMPLAAHESILVFGHKKPNYYPQMKKGKMQEVKTNDRNSHLYGNLKNNQIPDDIYYPDSVLEIKHDDDLSITYTQRPNKLKRHPTQKPLELWQYLISTYSLENQVILDPFCGSGTTALAARNLGRQFICGDLSPDYVAMANLRLQNSDPFQDSTLKTGEKQLSLFRDMG